MKEKVNMIGVGNMKYKIFNGNALSELKKLETESVQCIVTSPPYWSLRDYGDKNQIGTETTIKEYINNLCDILEQCKRVLRNDGVMWLNIGDMYAAQLTGSVKTSKQKTNSGSLSQSGSNKVKRASFRDMGIQMKEQIGIPWMFVFEMRKRGWLMRQEIIWYKPNPMPESVRDRATKATESLFMFTKNGKYKFNLIGLNCNNDRKGNVHNVWNITPSKYKGAHFATFPEKLIEPCILSSTEKGDVVLDPFAGSGTTGVVALRNGRLSEMIEINKEYCEIIKERMIKL